MVEIFRREVAQAEHKLRLDDFLFANVTSLSKMYLRDLLKEGKCEVNGTTASSGQKLRANDFVEIEIDASAKTSMTPEVIPLDIIFEDEEILVVNKPCGMLVHPTFANCGGTLLNALAYYFNHQLKNGEPPKRMIRAGLVHRLDKQTSGLVLIAKTPRAHRILCGHFERRLVSKKYTALVDGVVEDDAGRISAPIGRYAETKFWDVKEDGKNAETEFRVVQRGEDSTLLELTPITGRTNQLRIHCAHVGHPIVGDDWYGGREFSRLCLHASRLEFWHPGGNRRVEVVSKFPKEFTYTTGCQPVANESQKSATD
jgi:23S rRNA pseudouridine1911/1915/1917 synthase